LNGDRDDGDGNSKKQGRFDSRLSLLATDLIFMASSTPDWYTQKTFLRALCWEITVSWIQRLALWRVSSDWMDIRFGQIVCFVAGPAVLVVALYGLANHVSTRGEMIIGVLASLAVTLQFILIGLILPLVDQPRSVPDARPSSDTGETPPSC
jgi:hypothetical protein